VKRHYICDVIGDGTEGNPFRTRAHGLAREYAAIMPSYPEGHPRHGQPMHSWALVVVSDDDQSALSGVDGVEEIGSDHPSQSAQSKGVAAVRGGSRRQQVEAVGRQLDPSFNFDRFGSGA
jgi:hypothetical protein